MSSDKVSHEDYSDGNGNASSSKLSPRRKANSEKKEAVNLQAELDYSKMLAGTPAMRSKDQDISPPECVN